MYAVKECAYYFKESSLTSPFHHSPHTQMVSNMVGLRRDRRGGGGRDVNSNVIISVTHFAHIFISKNTHTHAHWCLCQAGFYLLPVRIDSHATHIIFHSFIHSVPFRSWPILLLSVVALCWFVPDKRPKARKKRQHHSTRTKLIGLNSPSYSLE